MNKTCLKCKIIKTETEFHKNKTTIDGYHKYCKVCRSTKQQALKAKPGMRVCTLCKEEKDIDQFSKNNTASSGLASWCKVCTNNKARAKRAPITAARLKTKEEFKATITHKKCTKCYIIQPLSEYRKSGGASVRSDCKTCVDKYNRIYRREYLLKKLYNISVKAYETMVLNQHNLCAICSNPEPHTDASLAVDHDHITGRVRELLCSHCNLLLGHAKDSIETLQNAISYLKKHQQNSN